METRLCVPDLGGGNLESLAVDRRKSEGWYNETVGARGAERASTSSSVAERGRVRRYAMVNTQTG